MKKFIYFFSCLILYGVGAFICSYIPINMESEATINYQLLGRTLAFCYFGTIIVRSYLMHICNIYNEQYIYSTTKFDKIINFLGAILGTVIVAFLWQEKNINNLSEDLRLTVPTLFFLTSWITIGISERMNSNSYLFYYYDWQKKKSPAVFHVGIFMLIWAIPVIVISFIFQNDMNYTLVLDNKINLLLYILPFIYAFIVNWLFFEFNVRHSWKLNDMNEYGESNCSNYYNAVLKIEFRFIMFVVLCIIIRYCIAIPTYLMILPAFIISGLANLLVNRNNREVRFPKSPDGKVYKTRPVNEYKSTKNNETKKDNTFFGLEFRTGYIKNRYGQVVGKVEKTIDYNNDTEYTTYEDKNGNTTGKATTFKW